MIDLETFYRVKCPKCCPSGNGAVVATRLHNSPSGSEEFTGTYFGTTVTGKKLQRKPKCPNCKTVMLAI